MKLACPSCEADLRLRDYLCGSCWWGLPAPTRIKLRKCDGRALERLRKLHFELEKGVPIRDVRISD